MGKFEPSIAYRNISVIIYDVRTAFPFQFFLIFVNKMKRLRYSNYKNKIISCLLYIVYFINALYSNSIDVRYFWKNMKRNISSIYKWHCKYSQRKWSFQIILIKFNISDKKKMRRSYENTKVYCASLTSYTQTFRGTEFYISLLLITLKRYFLFILFRRGKKIILSSSNPSHSLKD